MQVTTINHVYSSLHSTKFNSIYCVLVTFAMSDHRLLSWWHMLKVNIARGLGNLFHLFELAFNLTFFVSVDHTLKTGTQFLEMVWWMHLGLNSRYDFVFLKNWIWNSVSQAATVNWLRCHSFWPSGLVAAGQTIFQYKYSNQIRPSFWHEKEQLSGQFIETSK